MGKTVIDTCNYGPERDGHVPELDSGSLTSSELLLRHVPDAGFVKAFPALAAQAEVDPDAFRQQLRELKSHVKMDVIEHPDGLWEIVYGPSYTKAPKPRPATPDLTRGRPHPFWLPGWEKYSTWGYEQGPGGHQHLYAQPILNQDGADAQTRIWITPPRHTATSVDELAEAIAEALAPYGPVPPPATEVKRWLTAPPLSPR